MLELYYWPTPNGKKVTILLEELGVPYTIKADQYRPRRPVRSGIPEILAQQPHARAGRHRAERRRRTDPHLRIRRDHDVHRREAREILSRRRCAKKYDVIQWVMWQMGNQGPKFGEQGHFFRASQNAANGDLAYAVTRFSDEVHRLYGVMNLGLHKKDWLAAGEYTIADMICYPWASGYKLRKIDLDEFPERETLDGARWKRARRVKKAMEATLPPSDRGSGEAVATKKRRAAPSCSSTSARRRFRRRGGKLSWPPAVGTPSLQHIRVEANVLPSSPGLARSRGSPQGGVNANAASSPSPSPAPRSPAGRSRP